MSQGTHIFKKILKGLGIFLLSIFGLILLIVLLIRLPWIQSKITDYATNYVEEKTGTEVAVKRLFITFRGNVELDGLYLEDQQGDTLLYSRELEAGLGVKSLFKGEIAISRVNWSGLRTQVVRGKDSTYNFQFLIDALAAGSADSSQTQSTPDSSQSKPMQISVGPVHLSDFQIDYTDSIAGMDADLRMGSLDVYPKNIDLEKMHYAIGDLSLRKTEARVRQFAAPPTSSDTSSGGPMPSVSWQDIDLREVKFLYETPGDTLRALADIGHLRAGGSRLRLEEQIVSLGAIELRNSNVDIRLPKTDSSSTVDSSGTTSDPFKWPGWQLDLEGVQFQDNRLAFQQGVAHSSDGSFDPQNIVINDLNLLLNEVKLSEGKAGLSLQELNFSERSGLQLREASLEAVLDSQRLQLKDLILRTERTTFKSDLTVAYPSIDRLMADPMKHARLELIIDPATAISIRTAYFFNSALARDSLMQQIDPYPIGLEASIRGKASDLEIPELRLDLLQNTNFYLSGGITGYPDTNQLQLNIPKLRLATNASDLALLVDTSGVSLPPDLQLTAAISGGVQQLQSDLQLKTPDGALTLNASLADLLGKPSYRGELQLRELELGGLAGMPQLEPVSLEADFNGEGTQPASMTLNSDVAFQKLMLNGYNYEDLHISADVNRGLAQLELRHLDKNLQIDLNAESDLNNQQTSAELMVNLKGADLQDLNWSKQKMKVATTLNASFKGSPKDFDARLKVDKGIYVSHNTTYRLDSLLATISNDTSQVDLKIRSPFLSGELTGNTDIQTLVSSLQSYLSNAMSKDSVVSDTTYRKLAMEADFKLVNSPVYSEILLPGLEGMDSVRIKGAFKPAQDVLRLDVHNERIVYRGASLTNFDLDVDITGDSSKLAFNFDRLERDPVDMYNTAINLDLYQGDGQASMQVMDADDNEVFYTAIAVDRQGSNTSLSVDPSHLVLASEPWQIPASNAILLRDSYAVFNDFDLQRNGSSLRIETREQQAQTVFDFNNFDLAMIFSIFNAEDAPLSGSLNGELKLVELASTPAFVADLNLQNFALLDAEMGTLTLDADNRGGEEYQMKAELNGPQVQLTANGTYNTAGANAQTDVKIELAKLGLPLLQDLLPEQLDSSSGNLSGNFTINGPVNDLTYEGQLNFKNVRTVPTLLGSVYRIGDEQLRVDNQGIYFDSFTFEGDRGNQLSIDGEIGIEKLINPTFDLEVQADNFVFLDSERESGLDYFGKVVASVDLSVGGDLNLPDVDAKVDLKEKTDFYYVVPTSQAQMVSREGIVRFRNMKDSLDIFSEEADSSNQSLTGYDVDAQIHLESDVRFTVIIDPQSGDNLTVAGQADLNYQLSPNGNSSLTGAYTLDDGGYQLNFYELVKKNFELQDGSRILWSGDPNGARLDLAARYTTETAPASLMADPASIYKQKVPFEVMLYITGTIDEPVISFGLDMPEEVRGEFGGSVYQRLQQLNQNESELNKQVFSLVVFNRFLPTGSVGNEGGGTSELARSSVAKLLSGQLNKLADKYVAGVELDLDVDSYTDYRTGSAQRRTDLNVSLKKSFFDERVVVKVGTQVGIEGQRENAAAIGNVSVEYLIDEDGTYRAQAFRKDQYQNIVEGQVIITGLGILFNREFDTWQELWNKEDPQPEKEAEPGAPDKGNKPEDDKGEADRKSSDKKQ